MIMLECLSSRRMNSLFKGIELIIETLRCCMTSGPVWVQVVYTCYLGRRYGWWRKCEKVV